MKKMAIRLLLAALVLCLAAPCAARAGAESRLRIGITVYDLDNPYFATLLSGARDKCRELGAELIVNDPKSSVESQVAALNEFVAQGVDAVIVCALSVSACEEPLALARARGIKIISQSSKTETRDVWVSADEWDMGYVNGAGLGWWLRERYGADSAPTVAVLAWDEIPTMVVRGDGMAAGILEAVPGAKIVRVNANTMKAGRRACEELLAQFPNLAGMACANDAGAIGAHAALRDAGLDGADFYLSGIDATPEAMRLIAAGGAYQASVDLIPYENGAIDVGLAVKLIAGEKVPEAYAIPAELVTAASLPAVPPACGGGVN